MTGQAEVSAQGPAQVPHEDAAQYASLPCAVRLLRALEEAKAAAKNTSLPQTVEGLLAEDRWTPVLSGGLAHALQVIAVVLCLVGLVAADFIVASTRKFKSHTKTSGRAERKFSRRVPETLEYDERVARKSPSECEIFRSIQNSGFIHVIS